LYKAVTAKVEVEGLAPVSVSANYKCRAIGLIKSKLRRIEFL